MISSLKGIAEDFLSLLYPNCCSACSGSLVKGENVICSRCLLEMPQTNYHLDPDNPLRRRLEGRIPLKHVLAFLRFTKGGTIQHLLHNLKYKNQPEVGVALGKLYGHRLIQGGLQGKFSALVPVPLHPSRLRKRGYNQSAKFAEGLAEVLNVPVKERILFRREPTTSQTTKSKLHRWENVSGTFAIYKDVEVRDRHILLVDDVVTTGATIEACATILLRQGCQQLSMACIAEA